MRGKSNLRSTGRVTNELVQAYRSTSLKMSLSVVTDPCDIQSGSDVETHGDDEQGKVTTADLRDGGEKDVTDEVERQTEDDERTSHSVLVAVVGDDHEEATTDKLNRNSEKVCFHVGEFHGPDDLWHERGDTVEGNVGTELDRPGSVDLIQVSTNQTHRSSRTYRPILESLGDLRPGKLLVVTVVSLVDLVPNHSEVLLVRFQEPSLSHIIRDPKEGNRTEDQRDSAFHLNM